MIIDFTNIEKPDAYSLMTQALIPRPIAWILSDNNGNGSFNLAPFSYFTGICSNPPLLLVSVGKKRDGSRKDTWRNIQERTNFVVNIPPSDRVKEVQETALPLAFGESELERCGLSLTPFDGFPLPRLEVSGVSFGCTLHQIIEVGDGPQALILGRIERLYVADALTAMDADGKISIDAKRLNPLARLGSKEYGSLGAVFPNPLLD
jgi:flavin reductase (DIM6/NTAB) family NADH-FMN oxidoreductase RutF